MMMNKNNTTRCLMTLLLGMGMGGVVSAQTFSSIGEVKQLTSDANVTINFQPVSATMAGRNTAKACMVPCIRNMHRIHPARTRQPANFFSSH